MRNICFYLLLLLSAVAPALAVPAAKTVVAGPAANSKIAVSTTKSPLNSPATSAKSADKPAQPIPAWRLDQSTIVGKFRVFISQNAVRAEDVGRGCVFICREPDWKVVVFRDADKVEIQYPLAYFNGHGNRMFYSAFSPGNAAPIKWEPTSYAGLKAVKYFSSQPHEVKPHTQLYGVNAPSYKVLGIDFIMTDQIPAAPEISKFMQGLYCCSLVKGIPLANRNIIADQSWKPRFETSKAQKVTVDPALFAVPNYKITKDERAILLGKSDRDTLEDIVGGLDLGSDGFGEGKKTKGN
ncbi:MAG TPA: hypothetical protein V6C81_03860 [Planktothrix sp.]